MVSWDLRRLQQFLDRHEPGPLYLLVGDEDYLISEALNGLKIKGLAGGLADFNFDQFFASETPVDQVRDVVETLPAMSGKRVVVYRGAQSLKEKDWDVLLPLIEKPLNTTTLILVMESVDKRKKFYKKWLVNGVVVELQRPYDNKVPIWIDYIAFRNSLEISKEAMSLIHQLVGTNLSEIDNEMKKLKQFLGHRSRVEAEDVLKVVSQSKVANVFELTNAIGRQDRANALLHLANLLEHGQNEVGVLALVLRHVRILSDIREGVRQGLPKAQLSARAGVSVYFLDQYVNQSRAWDESKIEKTIAALHQTDRALKSSPVSSHIWLENFIIETCQ
jgi:DNA polymerase-3 subunit delta